MRNPDKMKNFNIKDLLDNYTNKTRLDILLYRS